MGWLFVPELGDSNSASDSPSEMPAELCVTSNGKPTLRPVSWRGWRTRPWIRLLSGTISQPSTATLGVERWISSLRDSRANHSASLANVKEQPTSVGSGPTSHGSSGTWTQESFFLKTCQASCITDCESCGAIFDGWVTAFKQASSRRQKLGRRIGGNDSSSWATPQAHDGTGGRGERGQYSDHHHFPHDLVNQAKMWPTPDYGRQGGKALAEIVGNGPLVLNPQFVEWLMGLPIGQSDWRPLAIPWSLWLRRMRGEL